MGCDYFADENGELVLEIDAQCRYGTGTVTGRLTFQTEPNGKIYLECYGLEEIGQHAYVIKGRKR